MSLLTLLRGIATGIATGLLAIGLLLQAAVAGSASDLVEGLVRYVTGDQARAIELLRPLADQGDAVAQEILGKIHLTGGPATRDDVAAFRRFLQAAERGRTAAQLEVGRMYRDGVGVSADRTMAMNWFDRAARQGVGDAYNAIGELYLDHSDASVDAAAARKAFVSGSDLDSAGAMYNLGVIYRDGRGVGQDDTEAYKWFALSAQTGVGQERESALRVLSTLRERLTPLQVGLAMSAVNDWLHVAVHDLPRKESAF